MEISVNGKDVFNSKNSLIAKAVKRTYKTALLISNAKGLCLIDREINKIVKMPY